MKHKCNYCNNASNKTRDELVELNWSFVDIRAPVRDYFTACPNCFHKLEESIKTATKGMLSTKWSED